MVENKGLIFKSIPKGFPIPGKDIAIESRDLDLDTATPDGGVILKNYVASFDPYLRGKMRDIKIKSYSPPIPINDVVPNSVVGTVVNTKNDKFKIGDLVTGMAGIEEYSVISAEATSSPGFRKIENPYKLDLKHFIGPLGMPGLTAYSSFYEIGKPKKGETIFISSASGAVGQIVGQLAKHEGLKVIGSAGDDAKVDYLLKEIGFDGGFNYKKEKPKDALKRLTPEGLDIYFDNVGGETLQAALDNMKIHGRIGKPAASLENTRTDSR
jgi:NADPH-dependent curcumin reductase CurA